MAKSRTSIGALARASPEPDNTLLVLSCMELQLAGDLASALERHHFGGEHDQLTLAGASLGAVTSRFPHWGRTFYEHLALARAIHGVTRVVLLDHRDCSVYERLLNIDVAGEPERERDVHLAHQQKLRRKIHALDPTIHVHCWLMDRDGSIEDLTHQGDLWLPGITERRRKPRAPRAARVVHKKSAGRARARRS
jgi:hypothetical protein